MAGITDIKVLLKKMKPVLDKMDYVFSTKECFKINEDIIALDPIATFLESEGVTVVVTKMNADKYSLSYDAIFNKITLEVHSSLKRTIHHQQMKSKRILQIETSWHLNCFLVNRFLV
jgi:uncharacterized protein